MKTKMLSNGEIFIARQNIEMIEDELGGPIPQGCIDYSEYSERLLSKGEVMQIAGNLRRFQRERERFAPHSTNQQDINTDPLFGLVAFLIMFGIYAIKVLFEWVASWFA